MSDVLARACATCRAHCCKHEAVVLQPQDQPWERFRTREIISPLTGQPAPMLLQEPNGDCTYLDAQGRCSIYNHRPVVCRTFDCGKWFAMRSRAERRRIMREAPPELVAMLRTGGRVQAERQREAAPP